jgi:hypothetical protein
MCTSYKPIWILRRPHTIIINIIINISGRAAQRRQFPPRSQSFVITHNDVPQLVGLLWTNDQPVAETST